MTAKNNTKRLQFNKPPLFSPTIIRHLKEGSYGDNYWKKSDSSTEEATALGHTGSFKYDPREMGVRSTQQLNIDWSDFANHTFFNSAQVKTNVAFDKIVNEYPYDGTKKELELFFDGLTGFEKYVYDQLPKNKGYLYFSGSTASASDTGTMVTVKDLAGAQFPDLSKNNTGQTALDPGASSMTVEMWLNIPSQSLGELKQTIISKVSASHGYAVVLETVSSSLSQANISMMVVSGGIEDKVTVPVTYNSWSQVAWVWNRTPGINTNYAYVDKVLTASSSMPTEFGTINTNGADLYIGSGSALGTFTQDTTFSGSIDELRLWHGTRSEEQRKEFYQKPVFADDNLKAYFKFNEPAGISSTLVLDYSNNSLHGKLNTRGITLGVREVSTGSIAGTTPMTYEVLELCPVLFPNETNSLALRSELLTSGSNFDQKNPNLITRLVPPHYFTEGRFKDGLTTDEGTIVDTPTGGEDPRESNLGSTQVLLSLLYTWAKFFDEMKLYIQAFSTLNTVAYNEADTVPSDFLSVFARNEGLDLPPLFVGTSIPQYIEGQNLDNNISQNALGLQSIQNQLWRRILINWQDIIKSKGTIHSIKAFIRSIGIDPDNTFRVREHGGPTRKALTFAREKRFEVASMLNFVSGGLMVSEPLSASRTEPGVPTAGPSAGNNARLTSGSFTYEGTYRFQIGQGYEASQSLARFQLTGSGTSGVGSLLMNAVAVTSSNITLYARPDTIEGSPILALPLTGANIFDGNQWYVSFGRRRNDDDLSSTVSSSYFLRAARQHNGVLQESYATSSYYMDLPVSSAWQYTLTASNITGSILQIGSSSLESNSLFFLDASDTIAAAKTTFFQGRVGQIRFWSKYLTEKEYPEHVLNFRSVGVQKANKNFNFATTPSGSWERLRMDTSTDQIVTRSNATGLIDLTDFTQNGLGMSGSGFAINSEVIQPERFYFTYISPRIDEAVSIDKVRIRSFIDSKELSTRPWAQIAPVNEILPSEAPSDDSKLSIDFSIIDTLDQDIMTIFSSLDELNNVLGNPELQFACGYKELEVIRDVYFNKLQGKINLKGLFEFYKWFDTNLGTFVGQLVPQKTRFLGTNFIVEDHFLSRQKVQYQYEDIYLNENERNNQKPAEILTVIQSSFNRY